MPVTVLNKLLKQAESLTRKEQLHLAICLINKAYQPETSRIEMLFRPDSVSKRSEKTHRLQYPAIVSNFDSREKQWVNR